MAPLASATGQTVFGPQDFEIGSLRLHLSRHSFSVVNPGDGYITITKNTPEQPIQAGFLFFNRKFIPLASFFQGNDFIHYKDVSLKESNHITVFLTGSSGASIDIAVDNVDSPIPLPAINFTADPLSIIPGDSSLLSWDVDHADLIFIDNEINYVAASGSLAVQPLKTTTYTLGAIGPGGNATESITVAVTPMPPTVEIFAAPETIIIGESTTLTWDSTYADTCVIEPDVGSVAVGGSLVVSPSQTTTYTISASGPGGSAVSQVIVAVYQPPAATISSDPDSILMGESTTLSWTTTHTDTIQIEPGIGTVESSGSITVSPTETTRYTLTASGPGGSVSAQSTVVVVQTPPVGLVVSDDEINYGASVALSWSAVGYDTVYLNNGLSVTEELPHGTQVLTPDYSTTYSLSAANADGPIFLTASVRVIGNPPEPQPEGSFGTQYQGLVPVDASLPSYDSDRFIVLTGRVTDITDDPLLGVTISILNHPEYGTAATDETGRFSIPANGGNVLTLVYQKENFLQSQRRVNTGHNDIVIVETIAMIEPDPAATTFSFDDNPDTVITHQSTPVTDSFGTRSCTSVFTGDNAAFEVDANGNVLRELTTITTRATEYTTPESMPAKLPPTSAFTYCVELSVDGVKKVQFEKPVVTWVNNFLGFDVGVAVPVGYYDTTKGVWVPSGNGVVAKLLDTDANGIVDALDADGDDQPDDLDHDGRYNDEVKGLEDSLVYAAGDTYWRTELNHFSTVDKNFPHGTPPTASRPANIFNPLSDSDNNDTKACYSNQIGSYVEERGRIVHEDISIPGTDVSLHYASSRVAGYDTVITVPASGDTVPDVLKRIDVTVDIAGVVLKLELPPEPNQVSEFYWNGLDYLGNSLQTPIPAHITVGFVYDSVYYTPGDFEMAFAQPGVEATDIPARQEIVLSRSNRLMIHPARSKAYQDLAEGWTISNHQHMNLQDLSTLHKGDGTVVLNNVRTIEVFAGNGLTGPGVVDRPALSARIGSPRIIAVDADGNLYFSGSFAVIYKVDSNGIINLLTGAFNEFDFSGDGGPAIDARITYCAGIAVDRNGNIYFSDSWNDCIRMIDTNGIITTIAGIPLSPGYSGDGGPATQAQLDNPRGVAVDDIGNLYIIDYYNHAIRKIDASGIITTIAGGNGCCDSGDGGLAIDAQLWSPYAIALDQTGNIYFTQSGSVVKMIDAQGVITTYAGTGVSGYSGDGGPASEAQLRGPLGVAVDKVGNVYIAEETYGRIRMVNTSGIITTVAGSGQWVYDYKTGPATLGSLMHPQGVAVDTKGNIYIAEYTTKVVKKVSFPSAFTEAMMVGGNVFSEESLQGHVISFTGLHTETVGLHTGVALNTFGYDENRRLVSVADRFGNTITITRDENGVPLSIISPDGITTNLDIDENNHLVRITYPDGACYDFEYDPEGLLTAKVEPEGNRFEHQFDENGRVVLVSDEAGGRWAFSKERFTNGETRYQVTTAEGNTTSYLDMPEFTGAVSSTITGPAGAETFYSRSDDGVSVSKTLPCGRQLTFSNNLDREFRYEYVNQVTETTPSGLEKTTIRDKQYLTDSASGGFRSISETVEVNGKETTINDDMTAQKTITSPEGRITTLTYDPATLLTSTVSVPGLHDTTFNYDARGRLISTTAGSRQITRSYNTDGLLDAITCAENKSTAYRYDAVGRVYRMDRSDSSSVWFEYDDNGNMTVLTNPNTIDHVLEYDLVNLKESYLTPLSGRYSFEYDRDRQLTQINFPSGNQITNIYDSTRISQVQMPEGNIDYTYLCEDKVETVTNGVDAIAYSYDGKLVTSETLSGTLNQSLDYVYNDDFNRTAFTYAGETTNYSYDDDSLMTGSGIFTINRHTDNGLPESVSSTAFNLIRAFNGYGEVDAETVWLNSISISDYGLVRDNNGRITDKTETVDGAISDYDYAYDAMGRLLSVTKDGVLVEEYQYDANGTRIYEMNTLRGIAGRSFSYSDEDHLLTAGALTYQYNLDGFLSSKTNGTHTTLYDYSSRGELLSVIMPDGLLIEYLHDPLGRRIAKKINGTTIEKYLWLGMTRLLAVFDGNNDLIMRFEYADARIPLAMTVGGVRYFLTYDQVGSLRAVANADGLVVKRISYDSFGNIITDSAPSFQVPFGFAGGLHDKDTNLVRFGYRDYDPDIGRWTAKDPIFFAGGDTDLYGYVLNDPINCIDPTGEILVSGLTLIGYVYGPTIATAVTTAVYQYGQYIPVAIDFIQGLIVPGPPPPTPGGVAGYAAREIVDEILNYLTDWWRKNKPADSNCTG